MGPVALRKVCILTWAQWPCLRKVYSGPRAVLAKKTLLCSWAPRPCLAKFFIFICVLQSCLRKVCMFTWAPRLCLFPGLVHDCHLFKLRRGCVEGLLMAAKRPALPQKKNTEVDKGCDGMEGAYQASVGRWTDQFQNIEID